MATIKIKATAENGDIHEWVEMVPHLEHVSDDREYHDNLVHTIACGLLYRSDWCPGSLSGVVITVDDREIDFFSHWGPRCL